MANEESKSAEVEIIGAAAQGNADVNALNEEIARLTGENAEKDEQIKRLTNALAQYSRWWSEANAEKEQLRTIIKTLVAYAKLG